MEYMNISDTLNGMRWRNAAPGTTVTVRTLRDLVVGATLVGLVSASDIVKDREYTVVSSTPTRVDLEYRGRKINVRPEFLIGKAARRVGPIVESSLRKGLMMVATVNGKQYSAGLVFSLTEASGRVFSFTTI